MDVGLGFISKVWALLLLIPRFYEAVRGGGFWSTDDSVCDRKREMLRWKWRSSPTLTAVTSHLPPLSRREGKRKLKHSGKRVL